jgi:hypothetical protein
LTITGGSGRAASGKTFTDIAAAKTTESEKERLIGWSRLAAAADGNNLPHFRGVAIYGST